MNKRLPCNIISLQACSCLQGHPRKRGISILSKFCMIVKTHTQINFESMRTNTLITLIVRASSACAHALHVRFFAPPAVQCSPRSRSPDRSKAINHFSYKKARVSVSLTLCVAESLLVQERSLSLLMCLSRKKLKLRFAEDSVRPN